MSKRRGILAFASRHSRLVIGLGLVLVAAAGWAVFHFGRPMGDWVTRPGLVVGVIGSATLVFALAYWLVLLLLSQRLSVLAVAQAAVREAIRMKIALVFIIVVMLIVPILPLVLDEGQPLRYRIQQFLTFSLNTTTVLLSLMTIFLACSTLSREVEKKQVFITLVKPMRRVWFIVGKWLGIVLLNAVLLAVIGAVIYLFTVFYLAKLPPTDAYDPLAVKEEILSARVASEPRPPQPFNEAVSQRIDQLRRENPDQLVAMGREVAQENNVFNAPRQKLMQLGEQRARQQLTQRIEKSWRSLGPRGSATSAAIYVFDGLGPAKASDRSVTLRYEFSGAAKGSTTELGLIVNRRNMGAVDAVVGIPQRLPIPTELIDDQGRLQIIIANLNPETSLSFSGGDLQVLYRADSFGPNFFRGLLIQWIKLAFLAALGLAAASFLGFPVAVMASLLVFFTAWASGYVIESLGAFAKPGPADQATPYLQLFLKYIALAFAAPLKQFSQYQPTDQVRDGLYIGWREVVMCAVWIGIVWAGLVGLVGSVIFTRRELARVQV